MTFRSILCFTTCALIGLCHLSAQNAISIRECVIEPLAIDEKHPQLQPYLLKLKLVCSLMSENIATLKLALDSEEVGNFKSVAENRVRKGKGIPMEFEIPIPDWRTERLSVFLVMQGKNKTKGDPPLANTTRVIEKKSVKKVQQP